MFQDTLRITFDDGREPVEVTTTQRDVAGLEPVFARRSGQYPKPADGLWMTAYPLTTVRMLGWLGYRRHTGQDIDWDDFDAHAVQVESVGGDPDPTQTATSDE